MTGTYRSSNKAAYMVIYMVIGKDLDGNKDVLGM